MEDIWWEILLCQSRCSWNEISPEIVTRGVIEPGDNEGIGFGKRLHLLSYIIGYMDEFHRAVLVSEFAPEDVERSITALKHDADGIEADPIDCPYGQEGIHVIWDEDTIEDISVESPF